MKHPFISATYKIIQGYKITPALALYLLENYNEDNPRELDYNEANKRLARAMTENAYLEQTGNTLKFLKNGKIVDGQHRLEAVVLSGKTITFDIVVGVSEVAAMYIDGNKLRNLGVSWSIALRMGRKAVKYLKRAASVTRLWMRFEMEWAEMRYYKSEMLRFYLDHTAAIEPFIQRVENKHANKVGFRAAIAYFSTENKAVAEKLFNEVVGNGENLRPGTPSFVLRDYLQTQSYEWHPDKREKYDFAATLAMAKAMARKETNILEIVYQFKKR